MIMTKWQTHSFPRGKKQAESLQGQSVFTVRQPKPLTEQIDRLSVALGVSRNGLVNVALNDLLNKYGKQANQ